MCGVVDGGIVAGRCGYEAGQSGVGDIFGWFADTLRAGVVRRGGARRGREPARAPDPARGAARRSVSTGSSPSTGTSGNRSVLVDHELSGLVVGLTLATRARGRLPRAARGHRVRDAGASSRPSATPVCRRRSSSWPAASLKNRVPDADVRRRAAAAAVGARLRRRVRRSGSAIHAAVAAGAYPDVRAAAAAMGRVDRACLSSLTPRARGLRRAVRGVPRAARPLRPRRRVADAPAAGASARDAAVETRAWPHVARACDVRGGLPRCTPSCCATAGRLDGGQRLGARARARPAGHQAVRASSYDDLDAGEHGGLRPRRRRVVEGDHAPSSDTAAQAYVYRHRPDVGGVVHTHSPYATAWAARGEPIPCVLTDVRRRVRRRDPGRSVRASSATTPSARASSRPSPSTRSPAVLMQNHGVFTIGATARDAVKAAVMCEDVARTVHLARQLGDPVPIPDEMASPALRALPERLRTTRGRLMTAELSVPHRQPEPVRPGDAGPGRRAVPGHRRPARRRRTTSRSAWSGSRSCSTPSRSASDARGERRARVRGRHRVDAHLLPGEDVDRRSRRPEQAAAAPAHPGRDGAALGAPSTWTS